MPLDTSAAIVRSALEQQDPLIAEMIARALADPANQLAAIPSENPRTEKASVLWPMIAALSGGAADVISTQQGLAKGGVEKNPLFSQNRLTNGLALSGSYVGSALLSKLLAEHGHSTLGKLIGYGSGAIGGASALHNFNAFKDR